MLKIKKIFKIFLLIIIPIITLTWAYYAWTKYINKFWIKLKPSKTITAKEVNFYRQQDLEWGEEKMWNTQLTLGWYGCLLSVIATSLCDLGYETNPKDLNNIFSKNDIYNDNWEIIWYKITSVVPNVDYEYKRLFFSKTIEDDLENGRLPMIKVKYHKRGVFHWVLIVWAEEDDFLIVDPMNSEPELMKLWEHGKVYAYRVLVRKESK